MDGISDLPICGGFIEGKIFPESLDLLRQELAARGEYLTDRELDDRLEAIQWAIMRRDTENVQRVRNLMLWVAVTPGVPPVIRVYFRPRPELPEECELLWIEERI